MTTQKAATSIDPATAEQLSSRFANVFETFNAGDLFSPDAFFDLNMPVWRFQVEWPEAFASQLKSIAEGPVQLNILRTVPTASGFVTEHEEHQDE